MRTSPFGCLMLGQIVIPMSRERISRRLCWDHWGHWVPISHHSQKKTLVCLFKDSSVKSRAVKLWKKIHMNSFIIVGRNFFLHKMRKRFINTNFKVLNFLA